MEQFTVQLNNATCTVCIGAGVLGRAGALLRQHVPQVRRWALAADENASALYGEWVQGSLRAAGLQVRLFLLTQYAKLDDYGRHTVASVMQVEYERCSKLNNLDD